MKYSAKKSILEKTCNKFSTDLPVNISSSTSSIKLELKPYLQPFEQKLAILELKALVGPRAKLHAKNGLTVIQTKIDVKHLRHRLTYWQRIGIINLEPTDQVLLELSQAGLDSILARKALHNGRRLRYGPHDLHEYRGKFFPQLVKSLINISGLKEGGTILDPMSGSGTTACEAVALGFNTIAADLNPLSTLISGIKAKTPMIDADLYKKNIESYLNKFVFTKVVPSAIWGKRDLDYLSMWFDPKALSELATIISCIKKIKNTYYKNFFYICLSNILRSVSWQKETDLRVRKEITTYEAKSVTTKFFKEVKDQADRIHAYLSVSTPISSEVCIDIRNGNAVEINKLFPEYIGKVDLLITSPPYATALPYLDTDRLSLIVLGLLPREDHKSTESKMVGTREISERERREAWSYYQSRESELPTEISSLINQIAKINHAEGVGFRRRNLPALLGKYFLCMLDAMRSARSLMKPGGIGYYVVGNNSTVVDGQKIVIPTDMFLNSLGKKAGWKPQSMISMELLLSRDIFKDNSGSTETILCFKA